MVYAHGASGEPPGSDGLHVFLIDKRLSTFLYTEGKKNLKNIFHKGPIPEILPLDTTALVVGILMYKSQEGT